MTHEPYLIPHRLMAPLCSWEKCFIMSHSAISQQKSSAPSSVLPRAENIDHFEGDSRWPGSLLLLSLQSYPTLCDPRDSSPPGSPISGMLQARILESVAISFSNAWKWKVKGKSLSRIQLLATPWTAAHQAPSFIGFSRQEHWSGVPSPSPDQAHYLNINPSLLILHWFWQWCSSAKL